jgi:hypothetical protein
MSQTFLLERTIACYPPCPFEEPEPALLAGLFHDTGKFAQGKYHDDNIAKEEKAVRFVERILAGTEYKKWIPTVSRAIVTMFQEEDATSGIGRRFTMPTALTSWGTWEWPSFFPKEPCGGNF